MTGSELESGANAQRGDTVRRRADPDYVGTVRDTTNSGRLLVEWENGAVTHVERYAVQIIAMPTARQQRRAAQREAN